jgi:hypothetical protein
MERFRKIIAPFPVDIHKHVKKYLKYFAHSNTFLDNDIRASASFWSRVLAMAINQNGNIGREYDFIVYVMV